jgi:hypothetical protein
MLWIHVVSVVGCTIPGIHVRISSPSGLLIQGLAQQDMNQIISLYVKSGELAEA